MCLSRLFGTESLICGDGCVVVWWIVAVGLVYGGLVICLSFTCGSSLLICFFRPVL